MQGKTELCSRLASKVHLLQERGRLTKAVQLAVEDFIRLNLRWVA